VNAETAIVLGSGLGVFADHLRIDRSLGFAEAGLPVSSVSGHAGQFLFANFVGKPILVMQGRVHLYEAHNAKAVTAGIRWMAAQGVKRVILTNAAGTLNEKFSPGEWMMISDQLNLTGTSPLEGAPDFVDMSAIYSNPWREQLARHARLLDMPLHQGIYAGLRGPQYETPAEIRMLRTIGADAVGMSTVLEAIQARALGMEVIGFSCLTNWAAGMNAQGLAHEDVISTGKASAAVMVKLLETALA
jgi:purine-nucleoside phosphorylase